LHQGLAIDPDNVKALFRRGKCFAQLNALDEAKADFDRVLQLQPDNNDAKRELRSLRGAFEKQRTKEQTKFAGLFDRINQDEEMADAAAAAAAAAAVPTPPPSASGLPATTATNDVAVSPTVADAAAMANPAAAGIDVTTSSSAGGDIGERLGDPVAFEPSDVHYAQTS